MSDDWEHLVVNTPLFSENSKATELNGFICDLDASLRMIIKTNDLGVQTAFEQDGNVLEEGSAKSKTPFGSVKDKKSISPLSTASDWLHLEQSRSDDEKRALEARSSLCTVDGQEDLSITSALNHQKQEQSLDFNVTVHVDNELQQDTAMHRFDELHYSAIPTMNVMHPKVYFYDNRRQEANVTAQVSETPVDLSLLELSDNCKASSDQESIFLKHDCLQQPCLSTIQGSVSEAAGDIFQILSTINFTQYYHKYNRARDFQKGRQNAVCIEPMDRILKQQVCQYHQPNVRLYFDGETAKELALRCLSPPDALQNIYY